MLLAKLLPTTCKQSAPNPRESAPPQWAPQKSPGNVGSLHVPLRPYRGPSYRLGKNDRQIILYVQGCEAPSLGPRHFET